MQYSAERQFLHTLNSLVLINWSLVGLQTATSIIFHHYWFGHCFGLIHTDLCKDCTNIVLRLDINGIKLQITFDVDVNIERIILIIMYPETFLQLNIHLPYKIFDSNHEETINALNHSQ